MWYWKKVAPIKVFYCSTFSKHIKNNKHEWSESKLLIPLNKLTLYYHLESFKFPVLLHTCFCFLWLKPDKSSEFNPHCKEQWLIFKIFIYSSNVKYLYKHTGSNSGIENLAVGYPMKYSSGVRKFIPMFNANWKEINIIVVPFICHI